MTPHVDEASRDFFLCLSRQRSIHLSRCILYREVRRLFIRVATHISQFEIQKYLTIHFSVLVSIYYIMQLWQLR